MKEQDKTHGYTLMKKKPNEMEISIRLIHK